MFITVLKDIGLRSIVNKNCMPPGLTAHNLSEALFSLLFAPSSPVVCDPTGVLMKFVQKKLLANQDVQLLSGADLTANEQLNYNLSNLKATLLHDINFLGSSNFGLC